MRGCGSVATATTKSSGEERGRGGRGAEAGGNGEGGRKRREWGMVCIGRLWECGTGERLRMMAIIGSSGEQRREGREEGGAGKEAGEEEGSGLGCWLKGEEAVAKGSACE